MDTDPDKPPGLDADNTRSEPSRNISDETPEAHHVAAPSDTAADDIVAALASMSPADLNMDLMLDHLTSSNDLFASPHLDFSVLDHYDVGDAHG